MAIRAPLALLTDRELRGWRVYRAVLVWPYAIAAPALGMAFRFILAPEAGFWPSSTRSGRASGIPTSTASTP